MRLLKQAVLLTKLYIFGIICTLLSSVALAQSPVILVMGDSLSAAYGINPEKGWVNLLRQKFEKQAISVEVINSSISGETSAGGLRRLPDLLNTYNPDVVILELGANDGLRGHPVNNMVNKLQAMIDLTLAQHSKVLLLGMKIPPNYGRRYSELFSSAYPRLRQENDITLVPFMLQGVATRPELMQSDGLHPTAEAQPIILDTIWPYLKGLLGNVHVSNHQLQ